MFICDTPYKILVASNIVMTEHLPADLYVLGHFSGARGIAEKIQRNGLFRNVFYLEKIADKSLQNQSINTAIQILHKKGMKKIRLLIHNIREKTRRIKYLKVYFLKNRFNIPFEGVYEYLPNLEGAVLPSQEVVESYNRIYCYSDILPKLRDLYFYLKSINQRTDIIIYEDGIGTYCSPRMYVFAESLRKMIFINFNYTVAVFDTNLFNRMNDGFAQPAMVKKIDIIHKDDYMNNIMCDLFAKKAESLIKQKCIILDTVSSELFDEPDTLLFYENMFCNINTILPKSEYIYKYHPRNKSADLSQPHIENTSIPFECYCYWNDMSDKVLITLFSTAAMTPKILYDQEPTIIFLYKLFWGHYRPDRSDIKFDIINQFSRLYRDSSKIYIPNTENELYNILRNLNYGK